MTILEERPTVAMAPPVAPHVAVDTPIVRVRSYRYVDYWPYAVIGLVTLVTRLINLGNYPRWFSDEGVYVSQAWAVTSLGELAPYTYWYDHPPLGWIQLAGWFGLTGALERNSTSAILAGREFMAIMATATAILIYALVCRLGMRRRFALFATTLYILSPLAIAYSRYVLLDNIAIVWTLLAMFLILHPQRRITSAICAGLCLALAALTKETALLFAPAVIYMGVVHYRKVANRPHAFIVAASVFLIVGAMYPLFALLKGELLPGANHVSLVDGQILFQLTNRQGSGSILDPTSDARQLAEGAWLGLDRWLPYGGVICLVPALFVKKLRGPAIALGVLVAMLLRGGYVPYPFIIGMLPFMAILVAGMADALWSTGLRRRSAIAESFLLTLAFAIPAMYVAGTGPAWGAAAVHQFTDNAASSQQQALSWIERELPRNVTLITEGELWLDVVERGYSNADVVWIYKIDTDPAISERYAKSGVNYLLLNRETVNQADRYPTVDRLMKHTETVATFGQGVDEIVLLRVVMD